MKPPIYYRKFNYARQLLPNAHLAALEEGVTNLDDAKAKTGSTIGYPGWGALYYLLICHLDPDKFNLIIETGTNLGCSTIILAQALTDSGHKGQVHTFEIDPARAKVAEENISKAGLASRVVVHQGNSLTELGKVLKEINRPVRFAFLDGSHEMKDVLQEFATVYEKLDPDGLVAFDNTYAIAEPPEDPRVNEALGHIQRNHGGNLINLPFVSWCTPGLAVWQKRPFPNSANAETEKHCELPHCPGMPSVTDLNERIRRTMTAVIDTTFSIFPDVSCADVIEALDQTRAIRHGIAGRAPGDLGDKIAQYGAAVQCARRHPSAEVIKCLEIGTLFGGSCLQMLSAFRDEGRKGHITCIDPFSGYYGNPNDMSKVPVTTNTLFANLRRFGFTESDVAVRAAKSQDAAATEGLKEGEFMLVLIDGDHSYEGVHADWNLYAKFVAEGGYLLFDDYGDPCWTDLTRAINEICSALPPEWTVMGSLGTTLVLRRLPQHAEHLHKKRADKISASNKRLLHALVGLEIAEAQLAATITDSNALRGRITATERQLNEKTQVLQSKDLAVRNRDETIKTRDETIKTRDATVQSRDETIRGLNNSASTLQNTLKAKDAEIKQLRDKCSQQEGQLNALHTQTQQHISASKQMREQLAQRDAVAKDMRVAIAHRDDMIRNRERALETSSFFLQEFVRRKWLDLKLLHRVEGVSLLGAGKHTKWLLGVIRNLNGPKIRAIADDSAASNILLDGVVTLNPKDLQMQAQDVVVLSTDIHQRVFSQRCRELWGDGIILIDLYEGCPHGPYHKREVWHE